MSVRQSATEIEAEAARWVVRLDREGRTEALARDLDAWLAVDTRRQGAFLQAEAAWAMLDRGSLLESAPRARPASGMPRRALFAAGAAALAAGVAGVVVLGPTDRYATTVGEIRRVPLADGSTAAINTGSALRVDLGRAARRVQLDKGEAWFQVARDASRPFTVEAGPVRVQAVGTAFSVRRRPGGADVLVTEGVVRAWIDGREGEALRLTAGSHAFVAEGVGVETRTGAPSEVDRKLAWRSGKIDLAGETLEQAVLDFNRYNTRTLRIDDPRLAGQSLYGVFRIDDPAGFATAVGASLKAPVAIEPDEIRIGAPQ